MFLSVLLGFGEVRFGSRDSSVVRVLACDRNVAILGASRSGWRMVFSRVNFLCWLLFWYPFHPHVTAVACKRCTHASYVCGFAWSDVTWCTVVWCITMQNAPRRQQFHVAPAMENKNKNSAVSTPLWWILKMCCKKLHLFGITCDKSAASLLESGE